MLDAETWILSITLIFGASSIDLGSDNAHCIPQIDSGLIYTRDLKFPSMDHASGVWNQYL